MRGNGVVYSTVDRSGHEESNGLPCVHCASFTLVRAPYDPLRKEGLDKDGVHMQKTRMARRSC